MMAKANNKIIEKSKKNGRIELEYTIDNVVTLSTLQGEINILKTKINNVETDLAKMLSDQETKIM